MLITWISFWYRKIHAQLRWYYKGNGFVSKTIIKLHAECLITGNLIISTIMEKRSWRGRSVITPGFITWSQIYSGHAHCYKQIKAEMYIQCILSILIPYYQLKLSRSIEDIFIIYYITPVSPLHRLLGSIPVLIRFSVRLLLSKRCCNLTKGNRMRNNRNGGCKWKRNLYNINKILYPPAAWRR